MGPESGPSSCTLYYRPAVIAEPLQYTMWASVRRVVFAFESGCGIVVGGGGGVIAVRG